MQSSHSRNLIICHFDEVKKERKKKKKDVTFQAGSENLQYQNNKAISIYSLQKK